MTILSKNENLACDLTVFTAEYREAHIELAIQLRKALIGMEQFGNGFKLYFHHETDSDELLSFAKDEQRCCGFLKDAEVYRDTESDKERMVLSLKTSSQGASAWTGAFFALAKSPLEQNENLSPSGPSGKWVGPAAIAGVMCMACVLPIVGAMLVARGLIPAQWNVGEMFYLITGGVVIGLWLIVKRFRRTRKSNSQTCGC